MENQIWFGVSLMRGQERVRASGVTTRADTSHTLKIHSVVMQKLHYWYRKTSTDPSAFLNVTFILSLTLKNSPLLLIPDSKQFLLLSGRQGIYTGIFRMRVLLHNVNIAC